VIPAIVTTLKYSTLVALFLTGLGVRTAYAQDTSSVRRAFEAGRYQQVIEAAHPDADPGVLFAAGQSQQKLGAVDQAREAYRRLGERPEDDPWHFIGLSASQLLDNDTDSALASAQRAVEINGGLADAHYQRGLVLAKREDWGGAAEAFDRVSQLEPMHAYAYYYAGLMHYRASRPDLMAVRFERFLKLAPDAPERPEVTQIMRTIRGR
jgi:tetratricopeptide (TPR) repeat protein